MYERCNQPKKAMFQIRELVKLEQSFKSLIPNIRSDLKPDIEELVKKIHQIQKQSGDVL